MQPVLAEVVPENPLHRVDRVAAAQQLIAHRRRSRGSRGRAVAAVAAVVENQLAPGGGLLGGVGGRPRLHHIGGLLRQAAGAEFDLPEAELSVEAVHREGFGEAHPHALVGLEIEGSAALGQKVGDVQAAGVGQAALGLHAERPHARDRRLPEALTHQAGEQHPIPECHVHVAAGEWVGHIEALGAEGAGVPVDALLLQEEAPQLAAELEVAHHHGAQGHALIQQGAGGACALHRRNQADAVVVEQGEIHAGARGGQGGAGWSRDLDAQRLRAFVEAVVERAEGQISAGSSCWDGDRGGERRGEISGGGEAGASHKADRHLQGGCGGAGATDANAGAIAGLARHGIERLDRHLGLHHRLGQADR